MAHEMGHVKNYDIRVSLIVFGLVVAIGLIADIIFRMIFCGGRSRNSNLGGPAVLIVMLRHRPRRRDPRAASSPRSCRPPSRASASTSPTRPAR